MVKGAAATPFTLAPGRPAGNGHPLEEPDPGRPATCRCGRCCACCRSSSCSAWWPGAAAAEGVAAFAGAVCAAAGRHRRPAGAADDAQRPAPGPGAPAHAEDVARAGRAP
ncbi:MAG: hypothetical protein M0C28_13560 [Candidatus Moduliflexus flocculans]|nr:hypothetical protein [Candidatus Moduliflexus flocculans]